MNEIYASALTYWRGLAARERLILAGGGLFAGLLLFYALVWAPLQRDLARLRVDVPKDYQQLQWMRSQAARVSQLRAAAPAKTQNGGLLSFVEQSAQAYNIRQNIKRVEPDGANAVRLAIDAVPFNSLLDWLANLQKQGGVRIDNATLEPQQAPGSVNARLLLRGPGS